MKTKAKDFLLGGIFIFTFLLLGFYIGETQAFSLFYREQQQLFLFDSNYVIDIFQQPGGGAVLLARFIVQFFHSLYWGVILTTSLLFLIGLFTWRIIDNVGVSKCIFPLCFLPSLFLAVSLLDNCFYYEGITSYFLMLILLLFYSRISNRSLFLRIIIGVLLTVGCFYLAGSVALLFAFCAIIYDCLKGREKCLLSFIYIICALLVGVGAVRMGLFGSYSYVYTPLAYYEITENASNLHFLSWLILPVCLLLAAGVGRLRIQKNLFLQVIVTLFLFMIEFIVFKKSYDSLINEELMSFYQYEYLTVNESWEDLRKISSNKIRNYNDANYLNLALVQKGKLTSDLFYYPQFGPLSLVYLKENEKADVRLAHVLFAMGNVAAAQNVAFNASRLPNGYNPTMLKMILQIDLMRGAYLVALKYIELLEKSLFYSKWATEQRKFLFNDELVEQDAFLGMGRRSFPKEEAFVLYNSPMDDLYKILDTNPENTKAMDYALAYLLLAKDINHVRDFVDRYYGTSGLKILPIPVQEALIFYSDYYHTLDEDYALQHGISKEQLAYHLSADLEYCQLHGVTTETIERFVRFKEAYGKLRQNQSTVLAGYEKTFWHYLLFAQI